MWKRCGQGGAYSSCIEQAELRGQESICQAQWRCHGSKLPCQEWFIGVLNGEPLGPLG